MVTWVSTEDYRDGTWEEFEEWIRKTIAVTFVGRFAPGQRLKPENGR